MGSRMKDCGSVPDVWQSLCNLQCICHGIYKLSTESRHLILDLRTPTCRYNLPTHMIQWHYYNTAFKLLLYSVNVLSFVTFLDPWRPWRPQIWSRCHRCPSLTLYSTLTSISRGDPGMEREQAECNHWPRVSFSPNMLIHTKILVAIWTGLMEYTIVYSMAVSYAKILS